MKKKTKLTQEELKQYLHYDPDTGIFTWVGKPARRICVGDIAGTLRPNGYYQIRLMHKIYKSHRLAWLYMEGYMPENEIDHIDGDPVNNKWDNLREVSHTCNMRNCKIPLNNKSGIKGVWKPKHTKKWVCKISVENKSIHIGYFDNKLDAAKARLEAEKKYGYPNCNTTSSAYLYIKEHEQNARQARNQP